MATRSEGRCAEWQEATGPSGVRVAERPGAELQEGEVAVAIKFAGLNHLDLFTAQGLQPIKAPMVICADGAGTVAESRDERWRPGDEVVVLPTLSDGTCPACQAGQEVFCRSFGILGEHADGTACERLVVPGRLLYPRPPELSWEESAAFPLTFLTAWRMLTTRARLRPGETLLVVGAGAGVSVAAVTLGKHLGARVLVTSRSQDKIDKAVALGAEAGFPSEGFSGAVREATGKQGADVIFDSVGAATIEEDLKAVRMGGRIVSCGSTSGPKVTVLWPRLFFRHADIQGSTMGNASEFEDLLQVFSAGVRPVVDSVFPLEQVQAALEHLDRGEQFGKVLLQVSE